MIVIRQEREHARQVITAGSDLNHPSVKWRQRPARQRVLEGCTVAQVSLQLLDFGPQRSAAHPGR